MKKIFLNPTTFVPVLLLGFMYGCHSPDTAGTATAPAAQNADSESDHSGHAALGQGEPKRDMDKMMEQLVSFSAEDREAVLKQHFCPVSGEMLGTMGAPKKIDVSDQAVWICCDGCKDKLLADPETYLAKLER